LQQARSLSAGDEMDFDPLDGPSAGLANQCFDP
jgi:hypothetical protein